jgi:hypothetical protein
MNQVNSVLARRRRNQLVVIVLTIGILALTLGVDLLGHLIGIGGDASPQTS